MNSRLITAAIALPVLIASIVVPQLKFLFVCRRVGARPDVVVGYATVAAFFVVFFFNWIELLYLIVPLFIVAALVAEMLRGAPFDKMALSVGSTVLGVFYVAFLGGHLLAVRTGFAHVYAAPETFLVGDAFVGKSLSTHLLC